MSSKKSIKNGGKKRSETYKTIKSNISQIRLAVGIIILFTAIIVNHFFAFAALFNIAAGLWLIGGWNALKRLATKPSDQFKYYYHVVNNTKRVEFRKRGKYEYIVCMKASLQGGGCWIEEEKIVEREIDENTNE